MAESRISLGIVVVVTLVAALGSTLYFPYALGLGTDTRATVTMIGSTAGGFFAAIGWSIYCALYYLFTNIAPASNRIFPG